MAVGADVIIEWSARTGLLLKDAFHLETLRTRNGEWPRAGAPDFAAHRAAVVIDVADPGAFSDALNERPVVVTSLATLHIASTSMGRRQGIGSCRMTTVPNCTSRP